ncbi:MAG: LicD family protein [Hyphomicrobiales bacterium]
MTSVDPTLIAQVAAALIAAALYVAAYLSFVRLLRFPRNWIVPGVSYVLWVGFFSALTVAQVSLSPDGIDVAALLVSFGFVVLLFFIISAPAMAFRPASPPVEFLAKHGDSAGLWLAGPALIAALMIPNPKLQAVLAAAMVIEFSWFLRQILAGRGRQIYSLNNRDLSVLTTQAKGDLASFRRRHGINELVLSDGAVSWRGCGRTTPPCPLNLYVNRLGLNTAPCCREHMKDLCRFVATSLSEMGVVHWLEGGSLLGAVRENGALLDWEDDIDISVLLDGEVTWETLTVGLAKLGAGQGYFVDLFQEKGFVSISFDPPRPWPFQWERNRLRGEIRADIAIYRPAISHGKAVLERGSHKGAMPATESGGFGVPQELVLPTSTLSFLGEVYACPLWSESYLRLLYGDFETVEYTYVDPAAAKARAHIDVSHQRLE